MAISIKKITKINDKVNYFNLKEQNIRADSIDEDIVSECMRNFLNLKYEHVGYFHEGLAWFESNLKYGFVNKKGEEVVKAKYDDVGDFHEGLAWFKSNGKYGFVNKKGEEVVKAKYDEVGNFHEGLAWFKSNGKYGLINKEGKEITDICFNNIEISADVVIFNNEYGVPIKVLSFAYCCKLNINGKEKNIQFDSMEKRDEFYSKIVKKIKDEKQSIKDLKSKMKKEILNKENKLYKDIDLEIEKEYAKQKKMD